MAKSTIFSRAAVTPKLSWPTSNLPFCTPGMIVAKVPFCTFQVMPSSFATALRRSTSAPMFWPWAFSPTCGSPVMPGWLVVPRLSPFAADGSALSNAACSAGSSATAESTSCVG